MVGRHWCDDRELLQRERGLLCRFWDRQGDFSTDNRSSEVDGGAGITTTLLDRICMKVVRGTRGGEEG